MEKGVRGMILDIIKANPDRPFTCNNCRETFPVKDLEKHVMENHFWN